MYMSRIPFNPNLVVDVKSLFQVDIEERDLSVKLNGLFKNSPLRYEKLCFFIDRMEFIRQIKTVSDYLSQMGNRINDQEVNGIQFDFYALRLYLVLSCVDMFATMQYKRFDEWILENCADFNKNMELESYLQKKKEEYFEDYSITSNFKKAIMNSNRRGILESNIVVMDSNNKVYHNDIKKISAALASMRNKYTHEGRRISLPLLNSMIPQMIYIGAIVKDTNGNPIQKRVDGCVSDISNPVENRTYSLLVSPGFDLIEEVYLIAIENARGVFDFLKE